MLSEKASYKRLCTIGYQKYKFKKNLLYIIHGYKHGVKYKILNRKKSHQLRNRLALGRERGNGVREEYKRVTFYFIF